MSDHVWFQENLACYGAGGMAAGERERCERHAADCPRCAVALAEWQRFDGRLDQLFAEARPAAGLEERVIQKLRSLPRRRAWPKWLRYAAAAAAVLFLGVFGAAVHGVLEKGDLAFPGDNGAEKDADAAKYSFGVDLVGGTMVHKVEARKVGQQQKQLTPDLNIPLRGSSFGSFSGPTSNGTMIPPLKLAEGDENEIGRGVIVHRLKELAEVEKSVKRLNIDLGRAKAEAWEAERVEELVLGDMKAAPERAEGKLKGKVAPTKVKPGEQNEGEAKPGSPTTKAPVDVYYLPSRLALLGAKKDTEGRPNGNEQDAKKDVLTIEQAVQPGPQKKPDENKGEKADPKNLPPLPPEVAQPPEPLSRKIIRTGDVEFEIESFDKAAAGIDKLIDAIPGAFVATTNSEKLPNGKVRGSVVVRVPPEKLDKFVRDLREEFAKTGELKSQRIGSQDISKQYTDVESRLKAARTMEDRLIAIIKSGKGEIKDLLTAERELGVWRTRIEEMEGEIRYFNNQVSLSTLTISMSEKEIRSPAAMVVTARVGMRLEVDRVEEALKLATAMVNEAKGRITQSDLKQRTAGQFEAVLHFEVAPAAADNVRQGLEKLGHVAQQEAEQSLHAEGGQSGGQAGGPVQEVKKRESNVLFQVVMYNVANIQPRETLTLEVASLDVPAAFRKMREAVELAGGKVRTGQLNEQDKLNITGQLDFDVPNDEKKRAALEKTIAEVGDVLSKTSAQAAAGEAATDKKIGYRMTLKNVAGLPPREKVSLGIEVKDVEGTAAKLTEMVQGQKGSVAAAQMKQDASGMVSALLLFDVPLAAKDELVRKFKAAGTVRVQQAVRNPQVPETKLATAHLDVTLTSGAPIVPSDEGLWPQVRRSLGYSVRVLSWSLMFIILGLSVLLPWALVIYVGVKLFRRLRRKAAPA